jgi:hypothetical protein
VIVVATPLLLPVPMSMPINTSLSMGLLSTRLCGHVRSD